MDKTLSLTDKGKSKPFIFVAIFNAVQRYGYISIKFMIFDMGNLMIRYFIGA